MSRIFVTPQAGLTVPSPDHGRQPLPERGDWVFPSTYWAKRIAALEVTHDKDKVEPAEKPAKPVKPEN